jgi:hypothetical protein
MAHTEINQNQHTCLTENYQETRSLTQINQELSTQNTHNIKTNRPLHKPKENPFQNPSTYHLSIQHCQKPTKQGISFQH